MVICDATRPVRPLHDVVMHRTFVVLMDDLMNKLISLLAPGIVCALPLLASCAADLNDEPQAAESEKGEQQDAISDTARNIQDTFNLSSTWGDISYFTQPRRTYRIVSGRLEVKTESSRDPVTSNPKFGQWEDQHHPGAVAKAVLVGKRVVALSKTHVLRVKDGDKPFVKIADHVFDVDASAHFVVYLKGNADKNANTHDAFIWGHKAAGVSSKMAGTFKKIAILGYGMVANKTSQRDVAANTRIRILAINAKDELVMRTTSSAWSEIAKNVVQIVAAGNILAYRDKGHTVHAVARPWQFSTGAQFGTWRIVEHNAKDVAVGCEATLTEGTYRYCPVGYEDSYFDEEAASWIDDCLKWTVVDVNKANGGCSVATVTASGVLGSTSFYSDGTFSPKAGYFRHVSRSGLSQVEDIVSAGPMICYRAKSLALSCVDNFPDARPVQQASRGTSVGKGKMYGNIAMLQWFFTYAE